MTVSLKGINGKHYIDLSSFLDMSSFDSLHLDICKGLSESRHVAKIGNLDISRSSLDLDEYDFYSLIDSYNQFISLPKDHIIRSKAKGLTENQLATYLKFALGGYDLYVTYHCHLFPQYFPKLLNWINSVKVFDQVSNYYIMTLDAGGISFDHHHPPIDDNDPDKPSEFIHIRPNLDRPFYLRDPQTLEKIYINTRAAYWNDQDRHGGDTVLKASYSLRVEGTFSSEFRNNIW